MQRWGWTILLLHVGHASSQAVRLSDDNQRKRRQPSDCAVGLWSDWSSWSDCQQSCTQERKRGCVYNDDSSCKIGCTGRSSESSRCSGGKCCATGFSTWGKWNDWSSCDNPLCGQRDIKTRIRPCLVNSCRQPCGSGSNRESDLCQDSPFCNTTLAPSMNGKSGSEIDEPASLRKLSVAADVLLGVFVTLAVAVIVFALAFIAWRKMKKKRQPTDIIDINLMVPRVPSDSSTEISSVAPQSMTSTAIAADKSERRRKTSPQSEVMDIRYHAPDQFGF